MPAQTAETGQGARQTSQSSFVMLTQMMGSSILAVPFVVHKIGWVGAVILLLHSISSMYFFMYYYIGASYYLKATSYKELTVKLLGKKMGVLLDVALLLSYYGFMVAYIIISSRGVIDFVNNVIHYDLNAFAVKIVIAVVIVFPLCLLKSLKQLSAISTIAGMAIFLFIATVVVYFFIGVGKGELCHYQENGHEKIIKYGINAFPRTSAGMGILWILQYIPSWHSNFGAHPILPRFLKELMGPYPYRRILIMRALVIALIVVLVCTCLVGFMGSAMFGDDIQQNILQAFTPCKFIWVDIIGLLYAFVVIINFPLVLYPLKASLVQSFGNELESKKGYKISIIIDLIAVVAATLLAMFLETIVSIFGLFASVAGALYYFIIPAFCFMHYKKLSSDRSKLDEIQLGESMQVDHVATAVIAMATGTSHATIESVRRLSNKIFRPQELVEEQTYSDSNSRRNSLRRDSMRRFSIRTETGVQQRTYSIKSGSITKQICESNLNQERQPDQRLVIASVAQIVNEADAEIEAEAKVKQQKDLSAQANDSSALNQSLDAPDNNNQQAELGEQEEKYEVCKTKELPKKRVGCGATIIAVYMCFCVIGVVFNMIDVIDSFSQPAK